MQQVLVIHGGTTFQDYNSYLEYLSNKPIYLDRFLPTRFWKERLQDDLGDSYQVLTPKMPNPTNARYSEWKLWFEHISELLDDNVILIGHSMGAIFLAKFLSENTYKPKVRATILIATPYDDESIEDLTDFKITSLSSKLSEQAGILTIINGLDDPVIAVSDIEKYQADLPNAVFHTLSAPDHFVRESFPELIEIIKEVSHPYSLAP